MAKFDPEVANSSGYFKDPVTKEDLSVDTPRIIPCSFENGKFTWPCVLSSDGNQPLKIVYKYFTDEEKELYKAYRGRPSGSSQPREHKPKEPKVKEVKEPEQEEQVTLRSEPEVVVKHSEESCASMNTLILLAECDTSYGVSFINGIMYGLVGKKNDNKIHHIPRSCIPDEEWERLCGVNQ